MSARPWAVPLCAVAAALLIAGCSATDNTISRGATSAGGPAFSGVEPDEITIGVIAGGESLPLVVAEREGLFEDSGVTVAITRFASAAERDTALAAGEIDAMVADLGAAAGLEAAGAPVAVVSLLTDPAGVRETTATVDTDEDASAFGLSDERAYLVVSDHYIALPAGLLATRAVLAASNAAVARIQADPAAHQAILTEIAGDDALVAAGAYRPSTAPGLSEMRQMLVVLGTAHPDIAQVLAEDIVLDIGR